MACRILPTTQQPISDREKTRAELIRKIQYVPFNEKNQVMLSYVEQYASSFVIDHFLLRMAKCYNFTAWGCPRGRSKKKAPLNLSFLSLGITSKISIVDFSYSVKNGV